MSAGVSDQRMKGQGNQGKCVVISAESETEMRTENGHLQCPMALKNS
jgi:hypothetical protein